MKMRYGLAVGAAAALTLTACSGGTSGGDITEPGADASGTLKVWLMDGSAPEAVTDAVTAQFNEQYPGVDVEIELQQWSGIQDKLSTSLNTDSAPCVVEFGNSLVSKYADAGLLSELTDEADELGAANWLPGMVPAGELDGERYSVPMYGGDRVVVYNKADFAAAGITELPTTLDELEVAAQKLSDTLGTPADGYSAFYFPGKYWYGALPFVWTYGGEIAVQENGEWVSQLDSAESREGLTVLNNLVQNYSTAPKDGDETKNYNAFLEGNIGMMIDSWWSPGVIIDEKPEMADEVGVFALPGATVDETAPVFLGGSDLAVPQKCGDDQKGLALEWIKLFTNTENQTLLAQEGGVIPNQQAAFAGHEGNEFLLVADQAAEVSKFTPVTPAWANVEAQSVLPDMLVRILTGQATVDEATAEAAAQVTKILNEG